MGYGWCWRRLLTNVLHFRYLHLFHDFRIRLLLAATQCRVLPGARTVLAKSIMCRHFSSGTLTFGKIVFPHVTMGVY
jgi:hypothetical protein